MHTVVTEPNLNETDRGILTTLAEGRNSPKNIADALGHSRQYVHQQMKILATADYISNVGSGVYELVPAEIPDDVLDEIGFVDVAALRAERTRLRERVAELEAGCDQTDAPVTDDSVKRARRSLRAARTALDGQNRDVDMARSELDAALQMLTGEIEE